MAAQHPVTVAREDGATRVTVSLPADLVAAVEQAVRSGQATSPDQFMADALRHELATRSVGTNGMEASIEADLLEGDLLANRAQLLGRFKAGVQAEIAAHHAAARPTFSSGLGTETGKLFMDMPDGRRFEYEVRADGTRAIVREVPR